MFGEVPEFGDSGKAPGLRDEAAGDGSAKFIYVCISKSGCSLRRAQATLRSCGPPPWGGCVPPAQRAGILREKNGLKKVLPFLQCSLFGQEPSARGLRRSPIRRKLSGSCRGGGLHLSRLFLRRLRPESATRELRYAKQNYRALLNIVLSI